MGLDSGEFWWRISRFNWFGHQSRFDRARAVPAPGAPFITGHLVSAVIFPPTRLPGRTHSARTDELQELPRFRSDARPSACRQFRQAPRSLAAALEPAKGPLLGAPRSRAWRRSTRRVRQAQAREAAS